MPVLLIINVNSSTSKNPSKSSSYSWNNRLISSPQPLTDSKRTPSLTQAQKYYNYVGVVQRGKPGYRGYIPGFTAENIMGKR